MKELLEWLEEYRLNTMSLMGIGDYEQGQIDVLTDVINRVDPNRCSYCGQKDGNHKISCPTTKSVMFLSNKAIPTLEGDEAEEFVRKADESLKAEKTDWTIQSKRAERILEKSRIAMRKLRYTKCDTPKVKRSKDVEP